MITVTVSIEREFPLGLFTSITGWDASLLCTDGNPPSADITVHEDSVTEQDILDAIDVTLDLKEQMELEAEEKQRQDFASNIIARFQAEDLVRNEKIPLEVIDSISSLFLPWTEPTSYEIGDIRTYEDVVYECIQAHTSQPGWDPPSVPALWKEHRPVGGITEWTQPSGAHDAYQMGERVTHNEETWVSVINNNTWEPGVYGWELE